MAHAMHMASCQALPEYLQRRKEEQRPQGPGGGSNSLPEMGPGLPITNGSCAIRHVSTGHAPRHRHAESNAEFSSQFGLRSEPIFPLPFALVPGRMRARCQGVPRSGETEEGVDALNPSAVDVSSQRVTDAWCQPLSCVAGPRGSLQVRQVARTAGISGKIALPPHAEDIGVAVDSEGRAPPTESPALHPLSLLRDTGSAPFRGFPHPTWPLEGGTPRRGLSFRPPHSFRPCLALPKVLPPQLLVAGSHRGELHRAQLPWLGSTAGSPLWLPSAPTLITVSTHGCLCDHWSMHGPWKQVGNGQEAIPAPVASGAAGPAVADSSQGRGSLGCGGQEGFAAGCVLSRWLSHMQTSKPASKQIRPFIERGGKDASEISERERCVCASPRLGGTKWQSPPAP